ncbi:MAG: hypothetical protein GWN77_00585, partial [Gammaproteobacteria bacterium]|nr:hypothetical protein [Gammaproteobacteria bacterium]
LSWNGNLYIATGESGTLLSSLDAKKWGSLRSPTREHLFSVTWDGKQFLAVGNNGTLLNSPDGQHWFIRKSPETRHL